MIKSYELFGVTFAADCELRLPEAQDGSTPRFSLQNDSDRLQETLPVETAVIDDWVTFKLREDGGVSIVWRDLLSLRISADGSRVSYQRHELCTDVCFDAYIANFAICNVLAIQGEETLHSTVVRIGGISLGFLGDSGVGKSTLSAFLLGRGAEVVTDDMLRISEIDGNFYAEPGLPRLKLFRQDAEALLPAAVELGRWNAYSDKFIFETSIPEQSCTRARLDALVQLSYHPEENCTDISIERIKGGAAFSILTASTMNRSLQTESRLKSQLKFASFIGQSIPIYVLKYPRNHDDLPSVVEALFKIIPDGVLA